MLAKPKPRAAAFDEAALRQNARVLEGVLAEFGVRGQIDQIRPGPVVTLYELVPAPGVKSARVVALSDDIARSMSVAACRVSVVPGRNAIGIELPNAKRETVYLRDLLSSAEYEKHGQILPLALGETIGGEPYIADLAQDAPPADRRHHRLGQVGGGQRHDPLDPLPPAARPVPLHHDRPEDAGAVGLRRHPAPAGAGGHRPEEGDRGAEVDRARDGGPLSADVQDRRAQRRRLQRARARRRWPRASTSCAPCRPASTSSGRPIYEEEKLAPEPMPYLVVVIDEVADLMMVAGKDIEGAVQRLAQMARAAGIHLIMATQRPSVDVITGTIKANFPTRISFQVTSKIDARTILGEQGAEQLLGQGDMLYMAGGGRITRLHGPFVSDGEVEAVARFLREQGEPQYLRRSPPRREDDEEGGGGFGGERLGRRPLRPGRRRGHPRPQGLDQLHPAPPADRLQPRRLADGADGAGGRRRRRQPRRQARDPGRPAAALAAISGQRSGAVGAWTAVQAAPEGTIDGCSRLDATPLIAFSSAALAGVAASAGLVAAGLARRAPSDDDAGRSARSHYLDGLASVKGRFQQTDQKGGTARRHLLPGAARPRPLRVRRALQPADHLRRPHRDPSPISS